MFAPIQLPEVAEWVLMGASNFIQANSPAFIPDRRMAREEFELQFSHPAGEETIKLIATTQPFNLRALGLDDFRNDFQIISGETRNTLVNGMIHELTSGRLLWSEHTAVVRTYSRDGSH